MKIGIMQPYFFPYIGYFQLMRVVDEFILYDNIEYTKRGWINRNRILINGKATYITLPLKRDSDFLYISERQLSDRWEVERGKMLNRIRAAYQKAPYFEPVLEVVNRSILFEEKNLYSFLNHSLHQIKEYLNIETPIITSSTIGIDHSLKGENRVIALCQAQQADTYINAIGGIGLYSKNSFRKEDIELLFIQTGDIQYKQYEHDFIPTLSILDVMMFNCPEKIQDMLKNYELI